MEWDKNLFKKFVDKYGTPLYAYNTEIISTQIYALRSFLPSCFNIFYSMKANPSLGIVSYIGDKVEGIEVASEGELFIALRAGISPERIIFVGPGKTYYELLYAIKNSILAIVVESLQEANIINEISKQLNKITKVIIRINPKKELSGARIKMGGMSKQFGIDEEELVNIIPSMLQLKNVGIEGIHVYMGTQILEPSLHIQSFDNILATAHNLQVNYGIKLKVIDFGGGFGVPYFNGEHKLDLVEIRNGLQTIFQTYEEKMDFSEIKLIVESGRFIVAESGCFLTRILYRKKSRDKIFLITDGGSNNHSTAAGIGRFARQNFPIDIINQLSSDYIEKVDIVGPLCTPTDVLVQNVEIPVTQEGDVIIILKSGAYGFSASSLNFLSHPWPTEIMFDKNNEYLIRQRQTKEELISGQLLPFSKNKEEKTIWNNSSQKLKI
ncbi:diaminopimelate decarboxylase [Alkaliphilus peptidifermentans]|uniref:Diaminopimelate decarboxylase n=1 Tax=Alkaliphilus peptidifermentans DSM 18978 TaxID=1120976 RepID=A0A1G5LBH5_9FIRM|nr:diaminopimelate decarboxylase [Alkaliphilus peptidifermentans]SCZ09489.1 diaminopimelate decarboxylase [Alkaliphilus peptidifermentans DSM 18978]